MRCKICKNEDNNEKYFIKEMMYGTKEVFDYMLCSKCGCLQLITIPDRMDSYYSGKYYSFSGEIKRQFGNFVICYLRKLLDVYVFTGKGIIGRLIYFILPINHLKMFKNINASFDYSILDVGSGEGLRLFALKNAGFNFLLGIDTFIGKDIIYSNGLKILKKPIAEIRGNWDIIMFNHSFEHMDDPEEVLNNVNNILSKNGICIIRIPVCGCYAWVQYGIDWVQIDAPRHFFYIRRKV